VSEDPVGSLLFTRDNSQLIVGRESAIESYAVDSGELVRVVDSELSRLTRLIDAGDGATMISSSANGAVKQHSIDGSTAAKTLFTEPDIIWSVAVDQRRQLIASASGNETVGLYQLPDGDFIDSLTGHTAGATNVFFLGDGKTLVVTDRSGMIHWWDIDSRRRLSAPWRGHRKSIWRMDLHPDRVRFATAGDDGSVKVWSALDVGHACAIGNPGFDTLQRQQYFGAEHRLLACEK
jgi:WD40 repeat protein